MTIAVTDACIFIDLLELDLTSSFFNLDFEVHTTIEVWNEIDSEQQVILNSFQSQGRLTIHVLEPEHFQEMSKIRFPRALSDPDRSVIFLAKKLGATLLSSDGPVRKFTDTLAIQKHGMFWILDELVSSELISVSIAFEKLTQLTANNLMYLNNRKLQKEIDKRLSDWSS